MKSAIVILASVLAVSSVFATEVAKAPTKAPVVATAPVATSVIKLAPKKVVKKATPAKSATPAVKVPAASASSAK